MKPVVRQMRGPGMNKGLKKPRHGKFPNPDSEKGPSGGSRAAKAAAPSVAPSAAPFADRNNYSKGTPKKDPGGTQSYLSKNVWG